MPDAKRLIACIAVAGIAMTAPVAQAADPVKVTVSCGALGVELSLCKAGVEAWEKQSGHKAEIVSTPNSSTERLALYQQILAAGAGDIDVLQIDVVWPGILAPHLIDLTPYVGEAPKAHFGALIANDTIDGKLVAMPWWTDAGVLYYRKDLLEKHGFKPPATWAEMETAALAIQKAERAAGNDAMWGFVWQGRAYEGLTCDALEWIDSFGGGTIVAANGKVTVDNPKAALALTTAAGWVGGISPPGVLNYDEEASRGVFQSGNAVFMRNWPYAWALAQGADSPVRGKVDVIGLPKGTAEGKTTGALGGWHLAVSRYSRHPEVAADLVKFLTSPAQQKKRAIEGSYNPTITALYKDKDVLAASPFFGKLYDTFLSAVARPSRVAGDKYNRVSSAFWRASHDVLSGKTKAEERLRELKAELTRMSRHGKW